MKKENLLKIQKIVASMLLIFFIISIILSVENSDIGKSQNKITEYNKNTDYDSTLSETKCNEIKTLCDDALGEYAAYKVQEETYTKYETNKKMYDELINRFENEIFPKCKEQLSKCN